MSLKPVGRNVLARGKNEPGRRPELGLPARVWGALVEKS